MSYCGTFSLFFNISKTKANSVYIHILTYIHVFGGMQSITLRFVGQKHGGHVGGTNTLNTITADVILLLAFLEYYRCPAYSKC